MAQNWPHPWNRGEKVEFLPQFAEDYSPGPLPSTCPSLTKHAEEHPQGESWRYLQQAVLSMHWVVNLRADGQGTKPICSLKDLWTLTVAFSEPSEDYNYPCVLSLVDEAQHHFLDTVMALLKYTYYSEASQSCSVFRISVNGISICTGGENFPCPF